MSVIDPETVAQLLVRRIEGASTSLREQWLTPRELPTRYFSLDHVLPEDVAQAIAQAFPKNAEGFHTLDSFRERKHTMAKLSQSDPRLNSLSVAFQDPRVIAAVGRITGIEGLEGDRSFYAGGLSMMLPGDFLNPHIDNSHDASRTRYRRINILYYLNEGWTQECGGNLELWDGHVTQPLTIISGFNRLVVMETHKRSWHSVSKVTAHRPRLCSSNYYFSEASPDGSHYFHVTSFTGRPEEPIKRFVGPIDNFMRFAILRLFKGWVPGKNRADILKK